MTLGPPPRCRCGNLVDKGGITCGLAICTDSNAPQDDPDETEGRALYRALGGCLGESATLNQEAAGHDGADKERNVSDEHIRWAIVGKCGLYTGQCLTRNEAIAEHVAALDGLSPYCRGGLDPVQIEAWRRCKKMGDRAVKVKITVPPA